jgi:hypothetical protein
MTLEKELQHEMRSVDSIVIYDRNPRKNDEAVAMMAAAIKEYGFKVPLLIKSTGDLIDGHLRLKAAKKLKMESVPVIVVDDLTDAQIKAFRISINRMAELAEWDEELLSLEFDDLKELGVSIEKTGFDSNAELLKSLEKPDVYTRKIEIPIYEIKGEKPSVASLCDTKKRNELRAEIDKADVPTDIKQFLNLAAERHVVFDFAKIAEFYAHQPVEIQQLMRASALVIIDMNEAIAGQFVELSEKLLELAGLEDD